MEYKPLVDEYYVYIDEAGDEGFGKLRQSDNRGQSRWLMLGAIIVTKENDRALPQWRDEILRQFPHQRRRDLHFNKLNHDQRVASVSYLTRKKFGACVVCSDKSTILGLPKTKLNVYKKKGHLYNYLVRFLLERVTRACLEKSIGQKRQCKVYVTFSKRGGTDYGVMRDYLFLMRDGKEKFQPVRSIEWSVLHPEDIKVEDHKMRAGLQIADVITSATYKAFEPNYYGNVEPRYATILNGRFIKENSSVLNAGITLIPRTAKPHPEALEFLKQMR